MFKSIRFLLSVGLFLSAAWASSVHCQEPNARDTVPDRAAIAQWLLDLNAPQRAIRFQAEQRLVTTGETVLEQLPELASITSVETRDAVQRVRSAVEAATARNALQQQPVQLGAVSNLLEAVEALSRASGNQVIVGALEPRLKQIRFESLEREATFFETLDRLAQAGQFGWHWSRLGRQIELTAESNHAREIPPVWDRGFRVSVQQLRTQTNFVDPRVRRIMRLVIAVDVEPRLIPYWLNVVDQELSVTSANAKISLLNPAARREVASVAGRCLFPLDITLPIQNIPSTVNLRGAVTLRVAVRPVPLMFRLAETGEQTQRAGRLRVQLEASNTALETGDVQVQVEFDSPAPELESHRLGVLHRDVVLKLADGTVQRPQAVHLESVTGLTHRVKYEFASAVSGDESQLIYIAPTLVTDVPITFEFKHVPIPAE